MCYSLLTYTQAISKFYLVDAVRGVVQSPYPPYSHGMAHLPKQIPWRAAGDPRLARGR